MNKFEEEKQILWRMFDILSTDNIANSTEIMYKKYNNNIELIAALVTVLNHKCWYYYENGNEKLSQLYSDLYYKYNDMTWDWLEKNGTEEEKHWYFETMD